MEQLLAFVVNISICFVILTGHAVDRQYSPYTRCRTSFKCCGTAGKIYDQPSLFDCSFYLLQQIYLSKKLYSAYRMSDQSSSYLFRTPFSYPSSCHFLVLPMILEDLTPLLLIYFTQTTFFCWYCWSIAQ